MNADKKHNCHASEICAFELAIASCTRQEVRGKRQVVRGKRQEASPFELAIASCTPLVANGTHRRLGGREGHAQGGAVYREGHARAVEWLGGDAQGGADGRGN